MKLILFTDLYKGNKIATEEKQVEAHLRLHQSCNYIHAQNTTPYLQIYLKMREITFFIIHPLSILAGNIYIGDRKKFGSTAL